MANLKLNQVVNFAGLQIPTIFFVQLEKVQKEETSKLSKWLTDYEKAKGEELAVMKMNATDLQRAYKSYKDAAALYKRLFAAHVNGVPCEFPTEENSNNVVSRWNVCEHNSKELMNANDLVGTYVDYVGETLQQPDFNSESLKKIGISLSESPIVACNSDGAIKAVESLYGAYTTECRKHKSDRVAAEVAISDIEVTTSKVFAVIKDTAARKELIKGLIDSKDLSDYAKRIVLQHFGLQK